MLTYNIVDFKDVASIWYNEILPVLSQDKALFVEDAGILYIKPLQLDAHVSDSIKSMVKRLMEWKSSLPADNAVIFLQEPKPVDNPRLQGFLTAVSNSNAIDSEGRNRILHLSNRRYAASSNTILLSQSKEIDDFLDRQLFGVLKKLNLPNMKFHGLNSISMSDAKAVAGNALPRGKVNLDCSVPLAGESHITVVSTNDLIGGLSTKLGYGFPNATREMAFLDKSKNAFESELYSLVV